MGYCEISCSGLNPLITILIPLLTHPMVHYTLDWGQTWREDFLPHTWLHAWKHQTAWMLVWWCTSHQLSQTWSASCEEPGSFQIPHDPAIVRFYTLGCQNYCRITHKLCISTQPIYFSNGCALLKEKKQRPRDWEYTNKGTTKRKQRV